MNYISKFTFIAGLLFFFLIHSRAFAAEEIYELVEPTKLARFSDITYYVRFPQGRGFEDPGRASSRKEVSVRGVLALVTWSTELEDVRTNIMSGKRFQNYVKFADKHNLALITWTNFKGYKTGVSGDVMDEDRLKDYEKSYRERAREWKNGYRRLCRRFSLPEKNLMIYGISGGGQMSHRLALQEPDYFFAVHIHVNSSYDSIRRDGEQILWLVTTGTREYGYPAGIRFYREALSRGYHMIFRAEENLGHAGSPATERTSLAFFEYCMNFLPDASDPEWRPPPVDQFYLMKYPTYIGDYLNSEAFTTAEAPKYMAPEVMVALPNKAIAEAWGTVLDFNQPEKSQPSAPLLNTIR
ncbi:hypothetical protein QEH52_01010 [Coraliomargarita sp. SDUM461003]|uniref:Peptidase S9 prolyl oligopeptidase catalytic domain-containing protein n=1 Tax=Thalassobacterium maritimum TaxID=3041265 RepID=A0ABU1APV2_9BACT|nr:hypothetical protein [Coraliomargarita sp. SDUM461003]MDQ8206073.1 hypothetical protein [Coraliomargarita sp. SDUM461003]